MPWFAAHAILYVRKKETPQESFPVWENVYLIEAPSLEDALPVAEARAREAAGDSDESFTWEGEPAEWIFAGIRKVITVAHVGVENSPRHCDEVTYSEFEVASMDEVEQLATGGEVSIKYVE